MNQCKEVSNPVFFNGPTPTEDGLLSNEIFGITKAERAGIYAYIDLGGDFMPPLIYKTLLKLNGKIADVVNGTDYFKIDVKGDLVPDPDGDTGIDWLKRNFNKIKFKKNDSSSRNKRIDFIEKVKDKMWVNKWIVIPAYYRDVDTKDSGIGVGEINKLYSSLIMASRALKETTGYGLTLNDVTKARVQNILVQIFDWFGNGTTINGQTTPANLPGKMGLIKRGTLYKTVDYGARLVMSAPEVSGEDIEDLMATEVQRFREPLLTEEDLAQIRDDVMDFCIIEIRKFCGEDIFERKNEELKVKGFDREKIKVKVNLKKMN
jgi:hypothetical protein